jgi:hypothetical protein
MDNEEHMENARYATNDDTPLWTHIKFMTYEKNKHILSKYMIE